MLPNFLNVSARFILYYFLASPSLSPSSNTKEQVFSDHQHHLPCMVSKSAENLTHIHFYFQDTISGKAPSAVQIAAPTDSYPMGFGTIMMADDPLTAEANRNSEVVGRAQGLYSIAAKDELALLMVMNYVFTKGEFNGSSIAVLGRNPVMQDGRELPVLGGTGLFVLLVGILWPILFGPAQQVMLQ